MLFYVLGWSISRVPKLQSKIFIQRKVQYSIKIITVIGDDILPFLRQSNNSLFIKCLRFRIKKSEIHCSTSFSLVKCSPARAFCMDRNRWQSEGARLGEYAGWGKTSQPRVWIVSRVILETCGFTLSCNRMIFFSLFLLTFAASTSFLSC